MNVLKMGNGHKINGINCQDATGQYKDILKVVCDGCSEGVHSEIGAKLFCKMLIEKYRRFYEMGKKYINVPELITTVMDELVNMIGKTPQDIKDYLSFTILVMEKIPDTVYSYVYHCGDGYILYDAGDGVQFKKLDCGEYPMYLAYNYIPGDMMKQYKDGVLISTYESESYKNVGVASDGIRFVVERDDGDPLKEEFKTILNSGKDMKMKLFFNRNENIFQDDFSIVY